VKHIRANFACLQTVFVSYGYCIHYYIAAAIAGVARNLIGGEGGGGKIEKNLWRYFGDVFRWGNGDHVTKMTSWLIFWSSILSQSSWKTTILPNYVTLAHQNWRLMGSAGKELPALGDFWKFVTKIMHFRCISAENLKHHFDWGAGPLGPPWLRPWLPLTCTKNKPNCR